MLTHQIAQQTYLQDPPFDVGPTDPVAGSNGTYVEIDNPSLQVPQINGPLGFQARAFFNSTNNELVIAFTGTEGFSDVNAPEFLPDFIADFGLAVAGVSPQDAAAQAFIQQATLAAQAQVGIFGSFDVTYVGHSLGGFLAQTASAAAVATGGVAQEGEVVVFNSPGAGGFLNLPNSDTFAEENYTYIYSDPDEWGLFPGAIHSVGDTLSDNIYYVPGSAGHAITSTAANSLSLGDVLDDNTSLVAASDAIFLPIDQALQALGATALLSSYNGEESTSGSSIIDGTNGADTLNGTSDGDVINGLGGNDVLNGNAGNDLLTGGDGNDTLNGGAGEDAINGGAGNDRLNGGAGNDDLNGLTGDDLVVGGDGLDRAFVLGDRTANSVSRDGNNNASNNFSFTAVSDHGTDTLRGVERIHYNDGRIALDIHGGRDADEGRAGYVYRLYEAVLDRAPDINGLTNWVDAYGVNDNWTFDFMAGRFTGSAEFTSKYAAFRAGAADTNEQYVRYLYDAAFDRTPDAGGLNSFVSQLDGGTSRAEVAGIIAGSQELRNNVFNDVKDGIFLDSFPAGVSAFRLASFAQTASLDDSGLAQGPVLPGYSESGPELENWFDLSPAQLVAQYGAEYNQVVEGTEGADTLSGSRQADLIVGGDGDDILSGESGRDFLIGGDGDDNLSGEKGRDTLEGGSGDDLLHGGGGRDVFLFAFDFEEDHDTITDFQAGQDQIQIDWQVFSDIAIAQGEQGAVVTYNGSETITLRGVDADTLSEDHFILTSPVVPDESADPFLSF